MKRYMIAQKIDETDVYWTGIFWSADKKEAAHYPSQMVAAQVQVHLCRGMNATRTAYIEVK